MLVWTSIALGKASLVANRFACALAIARSEIRNPKVVCFFTQLLQMDIVGFTVLGGHPQKHHGLMDSAYCASGKMKLYGFYLQLGDLFSGLSAEGGLLVFSNAGH